MTPPAGGGGGDRGAERAGAAATRPCDPADADATISAMNARARLTAFNLFVAFAFTVMADPVSSVAYALEAALRELDGDLALLVPTMALVVATIALVAVSYHELIRRFPGGGGSAEGLAAAFGEGWAFLPAGALLVDFTLTIAVSCAAAASALIAYAPELAGGRTAIALGLAALVGIGSVLGHRARVVFATATLAFLALAAVVVVRGAAAGPTTGHPGLLGGGDASLAVALLAMPLGMALATGVEAPSNAIAQLGRLDADARRRFGQLTLWLMVAIVGALTLALALLAVLLDVGVPERDSTLLADVARAVTGGDASFGAFQAFSALLLLAAAASSYLAGSGLLKALALHGDEGLLPRRFARLNQFDAPFWGVGTLAAAACALIVLAGGRDQEIVQFYAVAVFAGFLGATVACARLSLRDGRRAMFAVNAAGVLVITFVLALNLRRLDPIAALAASSLVSVYLWRTWVARGRPSGIAAALR